MSENTKIQWADHTWSPWRGCTKVSPGCTNCYAEALSVRNPAVLGRWGPNGVRVVNKDWRKPVAWDKAAAKAGVRLRVFPSLCDWLEDRPELEEPRVRFLQLIESTPHLDWLLLTKRPENFRTCLEPHAGGGVVSAWLDGKPPANVWYGVSVENQEYADERLPLLAEIPAAVRWVSYEPALGPVDVTGGPAPKCRDCRGSGISDDPINGRCDCICIGRNHLGEGDINWLVVGGESGPKARPFDIEWARSTVRQCRDAGVPVFVKQLGARPEWMPKHGPEGIWAEHVRFAYARDGAESSHGIILRDPKGGDPSEWPADLRVREMPKARAAP